MQQHCADSTYSPNCGIRPTSSYLARTFTSDSRALYTSGTYGPIAAPMACHDLLLRELARAHPMRGAVHASSSIVCMPWWWWSSGSSRRSFRGPPYGDSQVAFLHFKLASSSSGRPWFLLLPPSTSSTGQPNGPLVACYPTDVLNLQLYMRASAWFQFKKKFIFVDPTVI